MIVVVSMLRGVNVGGHNLIKMDALRNVYESLALQNPQTYVQNGNVVFKTEEHRLELLTERIESAIEKQFTFRPRVILRTLSELRSVVARNPFAARNNINPSKLLVTFLASHPTLEARKNVLDVQAGSEELRIDGRELYIYFPSGMARPKLSPALIEKTVKVPGTGRNWNSVTKLLEMAEQLQLSL